MRDSLDEVLMSFPLKVWTSAVVLLSAGAGCSDDIECTGGAKVDDGVCKCPEGNVRLDGVCVPTDGGVSLEPSSASDAARPWYPADSAADSALERDGSMAGRTDDRSSSQAEDAASDSGLPPLTRVLPLRTAVMPTTRRIRPARRAKRSATARMMTAMERPTTSKAVGRPVQSERASAPPPG